MSVATSAKFVKFAKRHAAMNVTGATTATGVTTAIGEVTIAIFVARNRKKVAGGAPANRKLNVRGNGINALRNAEHAILLHCVTQRPANLKLVALSVAKNAATVVIVVTAVTAIAKSVVDPLDRPRKKAVGDLLERPLANDRRKEDPTRGVANPKVIARPPAKYDSATAQTIPDRPDEEEWVNATSATIDLLHAIARVNVKGLKSFCPLDVSSILQI